jgi:hypothetical protein
MLVNSGRRTILTSLVGILLFTISFARGYEIKVQVAGSSDTTIILGHYFNKSMYPDDTTRINSGGIGTFSGKKALDEGMYVVFLPTGQFFQIMIGTDQNFEIKTDTSDFVSSAVITGSAENEIFFDFQKYMIGKQKEINALQKVIQEAENEKDKTKARIRIQDLATDRKQKINKITAENPDLFVSTFLRATIDLEVPDPPKSEDGKIDSLWQYNFYRNHFFDNFDPADVRLLRTPLYEDKIMYYLEKVVPQMPDTIIIEVDKLIDNSRVDSSLFRYLLITLFNYYGKSNIMGMDAVQVHLAEKYYLTEAWWSDEKFLADISDRVSKLKPLLIGRPAPDVELLEVPKSHIIAAESDSALKAYPHAGQLRKLYDHQEDFIVLLFWEASCSHCKTVVPEMYSIFKNELEGKNIQVIAVSTLFGEEGKVDWIDFINKNKLYDWINAWNPYDYKFKIVYDIRSTPQIFILNRNKEIIGKRLGAEQVAGFINMYREQFPNE